MTKIKGEINGIDFLFSSDRHIKYAQQNEINVEVEALVTGNLSELKLRPAVRLPSLKLSRLLHHLERAVGGPRSKQVKRGTV
ncbi:hypothetical protein ES703_58319 [subsurface metagenome]